MGMFFFNHMRNKKTTFILTLLSAALLFTGCHKRLDERLSDLEQFNADYYTSADFHNLLTKFSASYVAGVRDSLSTQSSDISVLHGKHSVLKEQSDATQTLLNTTIGRHESLQTEVVKAQADIQEGQQKQAALEAEIVQAQADIQETIRKYGELSEEVEQAKTDLANLVQMHETLDNEVKQAQTRADSAVAACDALKVEVAAIKEVADNALKEVQRVETELNSKLSSLESSVLALQQNMVITSVQTDAKNNYIIKYKEGKDAEEKTINVANSENLNFSKVQLVDKDNLAYTFTITNDGQTETFTLPAARDFITSIVVVSSTYKDAVTNKPAMNIVLNTSNGTSLSGVTQTSFHLIKGQTKSTAIEDFTDVKIYSIERVTDSKVPNEFVLVFDNISQDYSGLHLLWSPGTSGEVKVLSPAFSLSPVSSI